MLAERLEKAWRARRGSTPVDAAMRFSHEGLVLGAGTLLAKSGGRGRALSVDPSAPRLRALLAAAHGRKPAAGALAHLRKAAERWSEGQDALATMHLALSQVDRLEQPEADAHRLFLADGLLNAGFEANAILTATTWRDRILGKSEEQVAVGPGDPVVVEQSLDLPRPQASPGPLIPADLGG